MKKMIALLLSGLTLLSVAACNGKPTETLSSATQTATISQSTSSAEIAPLQNSNAAVATESVTPKYVFLFIGDGMSYPQFQSAANYLGALDDDDYLLTAPSLDDNQGAILDGPLLGILLSLIIGIIFTNLFKIHGAVMSSSESLLYSGYAHLNLTQIFMAAIFIGSSGAMMDLSIDITSAIDEVVRNRPDIRVRDAIQSGMNVGRAAMGTMTTTLLLAYSGGFIALLMVFTAQGTPIEVLLNYKFVSAELLHTLIGSFGLVTVAPFTAICGGILLTRRAGQNLSNSRMLSDRK